MCDSFLENTCSSSEKGASRNKNTAAKNREIAVNVKGFKVDSFVCPCDRRRMDTSGIEAALREWLAIGSVSAGSDEKTHWKASFLRYQMKAGCEILLIVPLAVIAIAILDEPPRRPLYSCARLLDRKPDVLLRRLSRR